MNEYIQLGAVLLILGLTAFFSFRWIIRQLSSDNKTACEECDQSNRCNGKE